MKYLLHKLNCKLWFINNIFALKKTNYLIVDIIEKEECLTLPFKNEMPILLELLWKELQQLNIFV